MFAFKHNTTNPCKTEIVLTFSKKISSICPIRQQFNLFALLICLSTILGHFKEYSIRFAFYKLNILINRIHAIWINGQRYFKIRMEYKMQVYKNKTIFVNAMTFRIKYKNII